MGGKRRSEGRGAGGRSESSDPASQRRSASRSLDSRRERLQDAEGVVSKLEVITGSLQSLNQRMLQSKQDVVNLGVSVQGWIDPPIQRVTL
eukprot:11325-Pyramimonas_sp.AAC.1